MRVVLTREAGLNDSLRSLVPGDALISEVPLSQTNFFEVQSVIEAIATKQHFGALALSSARSARYVPAVLTLWPGVPLYSVGAATAEALDRLGIRSHWVGESGAEELALAIAEGPVLFLGASESRLELSEGLAQRGIELLEVPCYQTVHRTLSPAEIAEIAAADVVFIGAPSAWLVAETHTNSESLVVVSGATTAAVVRSSHARVQSGWGEETRELLAEMAKSNN